MGTFGPEGATGSGDQWHLQQHLIVEFIRCKMLLFLLTVSLNFEDRNPACPVFQVT